MVIQSVHAEDGMSSPVCRKRLKFVEPEIGHTRKFCCPPATIVFSAHCPVRRGRRRVKRNRLVRRRLRRVDVKEERLATSGAVQLHGVGDCEVTGAGLGTKMGCPSTKSNFRSSLPICR